MQLFALLELWKTYIYAAFVIENVQLRPNLAPCLMFQLFYLIT